LGPMTVSILETGAIEAAFWVFSFPNTDVPP
jgi:hypothetical protein